MGKYISELTDRFCKLASDYRIATFLEISTVPGTVMLPLFNTRLIMKCLKFKNRYIKLKEHVDHEIFLYKRIIIFLNYYNRSFKKCLRGYDINDEGLNVRDFLFLSIMLLNCELKIVSGGVSYA